ncbi:MAG: proton-conducting transporter membrane subunit, partial [Bdellovibrionia bacterium]
MTFYLCIGAALLGCILTFFGDGTKYSLRILLGVTVLDLIGLCWGFATWDQTQSLYFLDDYFVSDPTSRLFLILIIFVLLGFTPYSINRVRINQLAARQIGRFVRLVLIFLILCMLAVFSNNLILMWLALEGTTLVAVPLIYHQRGKASVRAAWTYLIFSTVGLSLTFLGLIMLEHAIHLQLGEGSPTFFLSELKLLNLHRDIWTDLAIFFSILGLGTKLGLAPMYTWLPETYDNAPPSATVLLAAIQFNCAIVMLFRFIPILRAINPGLLNSLLITIGLLSVVASSVNIIVTKNYKRLISYASINHAGMIAIGLGTGKNANYGVILYVLSNALVKAILFFAAGNIKARFSTKNMPDLQGLIKDMPYSGLFLMIGIFALLGFAPFGSFIGELMILSSVIETGNWFIFITLCFLIVITFVATGRSVFPMIWGAPKLEAHE